MTVLKKSLAIAALISNACVPLSANTSMPAARPSDKGMEFFNPQQRSHSTAVQCAGTEVTVRWNYRDADGPAFVATHARMQDFSFGGVPANQAALAQINEWIGQIDGDVLIRIDCGQEGAAVSLIQAQLASTAAARVIRFDWRNGQPVFVYRLN